MSTTNGHREHGFSLIRARPFHPFFRRSGVVPRRALVRALIAVALTWVPLVALAQLGAHAHASRRALLGDIPTHVRFLVAAPLLILAAPLVDRVLRRSVTYLLAAHLVPHARRPAFDAAVQMATRMRDSSAAAVFLFVASYTIVLANRRMLLQGAALAWQVVAGPSGPRITPAGHWWLLVSIPLFRLLLFVWVWRFVIWSVFLFVLVRRRALMPAPLHPDGLAGLRVLARAQSVFAVVVFALSTVSAAQLAERAAREGVSALDYKVQIGAFVLLVPALVLLPMLGFLRVMIEARFRWLLTYGEKAAEYARFYERRIQPGAERIDEEVSTHCDLGQSFTILRTSRIVLVDRDTLTLMVGASAAPMAILLLSEVPIPQVVAMLKHLLL